MSPLGRELVVPVLMLVCIGLFLNDSVGLSTAAMIFPAALIAVIVGSVVWAVVAALWAHRRTTAAGAVGENIDEAIGPVLDLKPWLLVLLPALLTALLDAAGALAALMAVTFGSQLVFSRRSPAKGFLLATAVTVPTYVLFKYFLYVRFPAGMLGLG